MRREMSIIPSRDEHRQNEEIDGTRGNISYGVIRPSHRAPPPLPRPNIFSIHEPTAGMIPKCVRYTLRDKLDVLL